MTDKILNNLALIISLISLCLSMYNFLYSLYIRHKRIEIKILKYGFRPINEHNIYQFQFVITNKSQLPISISNLSIGNIYCKFDPTRITDKVSTVSFPINLNSLEAKSGWLEFKTKEEIVIADILFNCYTSRGLLNNIPARFENLKNLNDD